MASKQLFRNQLIMGATTEPIKTVKPLASAPTTRRANRSTSLTTPHLQVVENIPPTIRFAVVRDGRCHPLLSISAMRRCKIAWDQASRAIRLALPPAAAVLIDTDRSSKRSESS